MTAPALYQRVTLKHDLPAEDLKAGDVATLVDLLPGPTPDNPGAALEIFNAIGQSLRVAVVPLSAVEPLTATMIPAVRPLAHAG